MTDKRVVKMQDLVQALEKANIHAADCDYYDGSEGQFPCNCWCNPEQPISLEVNG